MINYQDFAVSTKKYYCGDNGYEQFISDYKALFGAAPFFLAADENTYAAAGQRLEGELIRAGLDKAGEHIYPGIPVLEADYNNSLSIREKLKAFPQAVPVAVGSGTLNDLVKIASGELDRPYAVFATAASVDGYASDGAALLYRGFKQTLRCPAPRLIAADTSVLAEAPADMTAAGYADLIAKIPAGADWLMADILGEDPLHRQVWDFIQSPLRDWTSLPVDITKLYEGLTATGFAMQYIQKSRPASGAEHLISHIWEMEHLSYRGQTFSHGFKVGVGSLIATRLMEEIFSSNGGGGLREKALASYRTAEEKIREAQGYFSGIQLDQIEEVIRIKTPSRGEHGKRVDRIIENWDNLKKAVLNQILPSTELEKRLKEAGCPVSPGDFGLTEEDVRLALKKARLIRDRYTILDFADDLGQNGV